MKCCRRNLENPDIIDGTAYFVCANCGELREVKDYRIYSTEEAFNFFREKYGFSLPRQYIYFQETEFGKVFKLPPCENKSIQYYFGGDFYTAGAIASIDPNADYSIHDSASSGWEWGLPKTYIAIEGDGHAWLALDYSDSLENPSVVVVETDGGNSLKVANSFGDFISGLLQYEKVYDPDGNIIW
jgi:hypothetical protein